MALIKCKECGKEISSDADKCPHCGKKRSKSVQLTIAVAIGFLILLPFLFITPSGSSSKPTFTPPVAPTWVYEEATDKMGGGTSKSASIGSINTFNLEFPYQGEQRATLTIRKHPRYGKDVILSIERGQFVCNTFDCRIDISFDGGKPILAGGNEPSDHSTTAVFIHGRSFDSLSRQIKKSKRMSIGMNFFQQGTRVFEFDVEGLKWP